jgi:hypothetical protein
VSVPSPRAANRLGVAADERENVRLARSVDRAREDATLRCPIGRRLGFTVATKSEAFVTACGHLISPPAALL